MDRVPEKAGAVPEIMGKTLETPIILHLGKVKMNHIATAMEHHREAIKVAVILLVMALMLV